MPKLLNFYMDDSGTRTPNRRPLSLEPWRRDFFALGGALVLEEEEAGARRLHEDFCARWSIRYPLHSVEIRHCTGNFSWLKRGTCEHQAFLRDLTRTITAMNVVGLACTIDRAGYDSRYREKYGRRQWHLCQTAFAIVVERAAKCARRANRKLRVMPEKSCRSDEQRLLRYFEGLRSHGPPFNDQSSAPYAPLNSAEFSQTLHEIRFKSKTSPMGQVADLILWPISLAGYDRDNRAYVALREAQKLIECQLSEQDIGTCGSKYSCFDLVRSNDSNP